MAVQAQYPSNASLLLNRGKQELKEEMGVSQRFLEHTGFLSNGEAVNGNVRKRRRPVPVPAEEEQKLIKNQPSPMLSLSSSSSSSLISGEIAAKLGQQTEEIDQFLLEQGEQLRRTLAELRRRHCNALLGAAVQRMHQKQAELDRAAKRAADLKYGLARLQAESTAWRAKAMADQATIAALQAQIQQAVVDPVHEEGFGESPDAESVYVDSIRTGACKGCGDRPATVVMLPCRHLSMCSHCESTSVADVPCPVCHCARTGSVQVFLS